METKRVMKKSIRNILIISIISLILIIAGIIMIIYYTSSSYKLTKLGYSKDQAKEIINLNKQDTVLKLNYVDKIVDILKDKYYMDKNLDNYISFYTLHTEKSISDIVAMVNVHADNEFYSTTFDADLSKGNSLLVNKFYKVNNDFVPETLVDVSNWYSYAGNKITEETYNQYKLMFNAAKKENLTIIINDSYRTFENQKESWDKFGDDYAARAGHSEHHTGLAVDVVSPSSNGDTFEQTKEYAWLQEHAHEYGFILRYPKDKEYITGYAYESWHYRYLGVDLATKVYNSGLTYDEYYAYYLEGK